MRGNNRARVVHACALAKDLCDSLIAVAHGVSVAGDLVADEFGELDSILLDLSCHLVVGKACEIGVSKAMRCDLVSFIH